MKEATMRAVLAELSDDFRTRDVQRLLDSFSSSPDATYAGSEAGEHATGAPALRELFTRLLRRQASYTFQFPGLVYSESDGIVWLLANGHGFEHHPGQTPHPFTYRVTGVLRRENNHWRWLLLAGSEPTPADTA
jgi:ketosteroid isomerase-like protein